MKLIIHDLNEDTLQRMYPHIADEDIIISDHGSIPASDVSDAG